MLSMAGIDLRDPTVGTALHTGAVAVITAAVTKLARLAVLFRQPVFTSDALAFIQSQAALFGIADFNNVTIASVRELNAFAVLADTTVDGLFVTKRPPTDLAALQQAMVGFTAATGFSAVPLAIVAAALRADAALVSTVLGRVALPTRPASALQRLSAAVDLASAIGVDGVALQRAISDVYQDLSLAADAIFGAIRSRYPNPPS